ncbi:MAG: FMN-dependent NADH-azoreductase [Alphaproteobacteria bacterium]|nr:FMN-dependent NADH-azoreductase [Alphaproteobacteria bacterium]
MNTLLVVNSSLFGDTSKSRAIAADLVEGWRAGLGPNAATTVIERDLRETPVPHLADATLAALGKAGDERSPEEARIAAFADTLIEEVEAADTLVIAAPMYNFTIPSTLKAWLDHIARAGRTFRYTENGAQGLLTGKKVYVVTARGGVYSANSAAAAMDFQEPYLRTMLGFLGLDDVAFIRAEGLNIGEDGAATGLAEARAAIDEHLALVQAA